MEAAKRRPTGYIVSRCLPMPGILAKPNRPCQVHLEPFCNEAEGVPASSRGFSYGPVRRDTFRVKFGLLTNVAFVGIMGAGCFRYRAISRWLVAPGNTEPPKIPQRVDT